MDHFPHRNHDQELDILFVGDKDHRDGMEILHRQFPRSHVHQLNIADVLAPDCRTLDQSYDYIYMEPVVGKMYGCQIFHRLPGLLSFLKSGGVICTTVYGYAGYYGLAMVNTIVKQFIGEGPQVLEHLAVASALVANLPVDHPAYRHREFMTGLQKGERQAFQELLHISDANVFTVSQVLACITQNRGRFLEWVQPHLYEPGEFFREKNLFETLARLPHPQRWEVAELVNAAPPEHCFLLTTPDCP